MQKSSPVPPSAERAESSQGQSRKTRETERTGMWHVLVLCFLVGVGIFFFVSFLLFETGSYHVALDGP